MDNNYPSSTSSADYYDLIVIGGINRLIMRATIGYRTPSSSKMVEMESLGKYFLLKNYKGFCFLDVSKGNMLPSIDFWKYERLIKELLQLRIMFLALIPSTAVALIERTPMLAGGARSPPLFVIKRLHEIDI